MLTAMRARVPASVAWRVRAQGGFESDLKLLVVARNCACISCTLVVTYERERRSRSPRAGSSRQSKHDCQRKEGTSVPPNALNVDRERREAAAKESTCRPALVSLLHRPCCFSLFLPSFCSQPGLRRSIQQTALVCIDASRSLNSSRLVQEESPPSRRLEGSPRMQTGPRSASQPESYGSPHPVQTADGSSCFPTLHQRRLRDSFDNLAPVLAIQ